MNKLILFLLLLTTLSIGYALNEYVHRGVPVDFIEYNMWNTTIRCVFLGPRSVSCWESEK